MNENNKLNLLLKENDDKIKQYEEKYNSLKNEKINNNNNDNNAKNDIENLIEKNNIIIKEKNDLENEIKKIKEDNKGILDEMIKSKSDLENNYNETIKENEKLQNTIKQLTIFQNNSEEQLNKMNLKYKDIKKTLAEKEEEILKLKNVSQINQIEKSDIVDPNKCKIITDKIYKNLKWYLIYDNNNNKEDENNYENYRWVNDLIIKKNDIEKYNKYETDEDKIKTYETIINDFKNKLEKKQESISKLEYQNNKLMKEKLNKTAGSGLVNPLMKKISKQIKNTSQDLGDGTYKNILEELNNNDKLKQKGNKIEGEGVNGDDKITTGNEGSSELILQKQIKLLKEELNETKIKLDQLVGQVKELLKNVKCEMKNKPQIVQICQILSLSPQTTNRIITNNKKGIII